MFNVRSIVNELSQFQSFVYSSGLKIIGITETWLSNAIYDNEILPTGYNIYQSDRPSKGGGVLLAIDHSIHSSLIFSLIFSPVDIEILAVSVLTNPDFIICPLYIPPNSTDDYFISLFSFIRNLGLNKKVIIIGDFNFPDINWTSLVGSGKHSSLFCELTSDLNLCQLVRHPTHVKGNILDLVLTNDSCLIANLAVDYDNKSSLISDHFPIYFSIVSHLVNRSLSKSISVYNFPKGDMHGLCNFLLDCDFSFCLSSSDIELIWADLKYLINNAISLSVPSHTFKPNKSPKWFNSNVRHHHSLTNHSVIPPIVHFNH